MRLTRLLRGGERYEGKDAHNGAFVKCHPSSKPTSVGFFVAAGCQNGGDWYARAIVRGFTPSHPYARATSLPVEKYQHGTCGFSRPRKSTAVVALLRTYAKA